MLSNIEVIKRFYAGKNGKSLNMSTDGNSLFSYSTCIAEKVDGALLLNVTKYSVTTSKQQTYTSRYSYLHNGQIKDVANVPLRSYSLQRFSN